MRGKGGGKGGGREGEGRESEGQGMWKVIASEGMRGK